jgi:plasmid stabilization system protein ParE
MADLIIHPAAGAEYDAAYDWYVADSPFRAARFEAAFARAIDAVLRTPELWPPHDDRHRFYKLKKFPYVLYYRFEVAP